MTPYFLPLTHLAVLFKVVAQRPDPTMETTVFPPLIDQLSGIDMAQRYDVDQRTQLLVLFDNL
jgi:hypothetical protein